MEIAESKVSSIMAPSTTSPSVNVALHSLVILNVSEHWTRVRAQLGKPMRVFGALLGRQKGRHIELCTSFEMKMNPNPENAELEEIDLEFLNTNIGQFKQVFSDLDFLGWYTTGALPIENDIALHKQVCTINESPVLLKLDPFGKHTDLPVYIYESIIDLVNGEVTMLFIGIEFSLATDEAERIGVEHIAKLSSSDTMVQSTVSEHLNTQYSAISLLNNRIKVIYEYVKAVKENKGNVKKNNEILRDIQSLCNRLPAMNSSNFYREFYTLYNDVTWISYLGVITQGSNTLNQTTYLGTSYLDLAKSAVENFLKIRSRDQLNARNDRYMLLTLEEPPLNIKVGWKEHMSIFTSALKNLRAMGLTNINPVLKQAFDLLNLNRLSSGMDTFGQGRCPFYLEPSLIILITDGCKLMNSVSTYDKLSLPLANCIMDNELTNEPFRWDQRFFLISLNLGSVPVQEPNQNTFIPYATNSPINSMCEVTGGRSYLISSQRMLYQCLESLVAKIQAGVVVNFEKFGNDPPHHKGEDISLQLKSDRLWENCKRMIFIPKTSAKTYAIGHWPIPEDYWLPLNSQTLPKRSAHPVIKFKCDPTDAMAIDEIPFDKYELEPSPLTQFILERRQPNVAWQCFVPNSGPKLNDLGYPFGYIKGSTNMMSVNLFVLPYNYPVLFQLISELFQNLKLKPSKIWTDRFDMYLKNIPPYYYGPLRRVLSKKGLQHLIAENLENCLSGQVQSYLKKVKTQAKIGFEQVCAHPTINVDTMSLLTSIPNNIILKRQQVECYQDSKEFTNWITSTSDSIRADLLRQQFAEFNNFIIYVREKRKTKPIFFKDPCDTSRDKLIEVIQKMRTNFFYKFKNADEDDLHSISIQDMGNYHEYLKNQVQPLRELDPQKVRQHMFGNPFKLVSQEQRNSMFGADEIDEVFEESAENQLQNNQKIAETVKIKRTGSVVGGPANKRRGASKGPLSKRINYLKNLYTSNTSSASSVISDSSDVELLDETVSEITTTTYNSSYLNESMANETRLNQQQLSEMNPDVANLNDFNDEGMKLNSIDLMEGNGLLQDPGQDVMEIGGAPVQQQPRPASASSHSSGSSNEATTDYNSNLISSSLCDNYIEQSYIHLKILCLEKVKKPGRDFSELFGLIENSQLSIRMRLFLLKELTYEATRFKRTKMVETINKYSELLQQLQQA